MASLTSEGLYARIFDDPYGAATALVAEGEIWGTALRVRAVNESQVVYLATFEPIPALAAEEFPTEIAWIVIDRAAQSMWAVPARGRNRQWKHKNPGEADPHLYEIIRPPNGRIRQEGELCLFYPRDPRAARWAWGNGPTEFILIAQRHLWWEEYARRNNGDWPHEDAPHGHPPDGTQHPVITEKMRKAIEGQRT